MIEGSNPVDGAQTALGNADPGVASLMAAHVGRKPGKRHKGGPRKHHKSAKRVKRSVRM